MHLFSSNILSAESAQTSFTLWGTWPLLFAHGTYSSHYKSGDLNSSRAIFCSYLKCYAQSKHISHVCLFGVIYEHPNTVSEKKPKNNLNSKKHKCNLLGFKTLWDKSNNINPPPAFAFWLLHDYQPACMRTAPEKMRGGEAVPLLTDLTTLLCVCECLQKRFRGYFNS